MKEGRKYLAFLKLIRISSKSLVFSPVIYRDGLEPAGRMLTLPGLKNFRMLFVVSTIRKVTDFVL
jgi:hypothetical protein